MKQDETFEARHCPHCGVYAHFKSYQTGDFHDALVEHTFSGEIDGHKILNFHCQHCGKTVLYIFYGKYIIHYPTLPTGRFQQSSYEQYYPKGNKRPVPPDTPKDVLKDFEEACSIESLSSNGASVMACRALQNTIRKHLDPSKHGKLNNELEEFTKIETLPAELKDMTHVVRKFSNIARHPEQVEDTTVNVSPEEVAGVLDFTQEILRYFHEELPQKKKRLADLQQRAEAKTKKDPKSGQP